MTGLRWRYMFVLRQIPSTNHTVVSFLIRAPVVTTAYTALAPLLTHKHFFFTLPPCRGTITIIIIRIMTINDDDNQGMMEQHCPSVWYLMILRSTCIIFQFFSVFIICSVYFSSFSVFFSVFQYLYRTQLLKLATDFDSF